MKSPKFLSSYTSLEKSWVVYDIGNSAFTLLVTTLIRRMRPEEEVE